MCGLGPDLGAGMFLGPDDKAFQCDASPDVTATDVCGTAMPATAHYEWTSCAPPAAVDGGLPPPPHGGGGASTGTADITTTYTVSPNGVCDDSTTLSTERVATFSIQRSDPHGRSMKETGKTVATSTHGLNATDYTETINVDTTRARLQTDGTTLDSLHITGAVTVSFTGSGDALVRTFSGSTNAVLSTGDTTIVTLIAVARPSPTVCFWPTSGTVQRTGSDGTTHTLVFNSTCGQATLDGTAFTLRAGGPHGGRHGGPRPE
jgi:hypothetical protein